MKTCDVIVIGAGGVGTAAAGEIARRGAQAIAIDRFAPGHDQGSSHGQSRIIRQAYFEHSDYVPLLLEAYRLWHRLEERRGQRLLDPVGLVEIGAARWDGRGGGSGLRGHSPTRRRAALGQTDRTPVSWPARARTVGRRIRARGGLFARRAGRHRASGRSRTSRSQIASGRECARLASPRRRG